MNGRLDHLALEQALGRCASEPIRTPGSIQPHGALFVLDPETRRITHAAIGEARVLLATEAVLGRSLDEACPALTPNVAALERLPESGLAHIASVERAGLWHVVAHRAAPGIIVEIEHGGADGLRSLEELHPQVRRLLEALPGCAGMTSMAELAAQEVRRITGMDRVLIYRFDEEWNGAVAAEDGNGRLPSYLELRFPAADIPAQARELYRLNRLRLIPDANYDPVPIETSRENAAPPLDLGFAVLRSVSPVHLQYMRNMGTLASMSVSLLQGDRLWGLISCHSAAPHRVSYPVRAACDLIGQVLSLQIAAREASARADRRAALQEIERRLLARMAAADHYLNGLTAAESDLLGMARASGAAVVTGGTCRLVGATPDEDEVRALANWLGREGRHDLFASDHVASAVPGGESLRERASGVLAIAISQLHDSYVIWFRPELVRTIRWGGDPAKRAELGPEGARLNPRSSFDEWRETVHCRSAPWDEAEIEAARDLRSAIVDIVLRNAEEQAALSDRLTAINKELEAFSYSVSHDLRAPFRHIVGYAQLLRKSEGETLSERGNRYLETIVESALSAGRLVDDLLSFSQMGRAAIRPIQIDMDQLLREVRRTLVPEDSSRAIDWHVGSLACIQGDPVMIRLVLQNLVENALKFTRDREVAVIEIGCETESDSIIYRVKDNGVGFDQAYVGKLFGVFQRLHRVEEFEGTGIGLANVKRIVERHGGRVWAEGAVDHGATIWFALPKEPAR